MMAVALDKRERPTNDLRWPAIPLLVLALALLIGAAAFAWSQRSDFFRVAQTAVVIEQPFHGGKKQTVQGSVVWRLVQHAADDPEIAATIEVPQHGLTLTLSIRKNTDASLPASHLVTLAVETPKAFPDRAIAEVGMIGFEALPGDSRKELAGTVVDLGDGNFLIGLSPAPPDVTYNLDLMRTLGVLELPLTYKSGRQATLIFEEGSTGRPLFGQATSAWQP